jgi:hypothetical protein
MSSSDNLQLELLCPSAVRPTAQPTAVGIESHRQVAEKDRPKRFFALTEKAAERCVLRPPGSKLIVKKGRHSPGAVIIAAVARQRESLDRFRVRNKKAVAKSTHKRQVFSLFSRSAATPLRRRCGARFNQQICL